MVPQRPINHRTVMLKVVILGDGGVGKSCLMNRFVTNQYDENSFHTIGVEFLNQDIEVDGETYSLQIWDTAGQERFRALRTPFYRGSDICILCYAINDRESFKGLKMWREEFLKYADVDPEQAEAFPFVVVGNKNDIAPTKRVVQRAEVSAWCQEYHISGFIETSAKTSENVREAFTLAVKRSQKFERAIDCRRGLDGAEPSIIDLTRKVNLNQTESSCCGNLTNSNPTSAQNSPQRNRHEVFQ